MRYLIIPMLSLLIVGCSSAPVATQQRTVGDIRFNCEPGSFNNLVFFVEGGKEALVTPWPAACEKLGQWLVNDDRGEEEEPEPVRSVHPRMRGKRGKK